MSADPRQSGTGTATWMSDTRAYNLIWMGRWIERAEGIARAILMPEDPPVMNGTAVAVMTQKLTSVADAWGVTYDSPEHVQGVIGDYIIRCLETARDDAEQVGPIDLIRALNTILDEFPVTWAFARGPNQLHRAAEMLCSRLATVSAAIEARWFRPIE